MDALQIAKKYVNANPHITSNQDKIALDIAIMMVNYAQDEVADLRKIFNLPSLSQHAANLKALLDVPTLARNLNKAYVNDELDLSNTSFDDREPQ